MSPWWTPIWHSCDMSQGIQGVEADLVRRRPCPWTSLQEFWNLGGERYNMGSGGHLCLTTYFGDLLTTEMSADLQGQTQRHFFWGVSCKAAMWPRRRSLEARRPSNVNPSSAQWKRADTRRWCSNSVRPQTTFPLARANWMVLEATRLLRDYGLQTQSRKQKW